MNNSISYYGLNTNPFNKDIKTEMLFKGDSFKEGMNRLNYLKEVKGIGLLVGATGVGKTTLLRAFKDSLNKEKYNIIYLNLTSMKKFEFLNIICNNLGINVGDCYITSIERKVQEEIIKQKEEYGKETIILIDNVDKYSKEILKNLNFLYEFDMDREDYTSILLCGEINMLDELSKSVYESIKQRIVCKYKMSTLSNKEVKEYIETRLEISNQTNSIFTNNAITALSNVSHGVIRKLNSLINIALIIGYQYKKKEIDEEIIRIAVEENRI